ncbi:LysE family translocator [Paenibacillus mucilaginosus]|uniref:Amino acid transporter LysE n=1 Tax=Paenibacillus mucilaginosus (strain KNP414) TaxID=1036673 RepID=F8FDX2_PAEMK|nr:LysE family translocator [Paenibacillus mucilaginosus]AEI43172.1 amino acid transporter LysE [Paenibacillus mucilaginosus KNP414]MCG7212264.1 LysE family translocator [Paenibacillus mucilaginosus]WDM24773.1 LysE family translocator [Paenibacillus mucilaginosus]
MSAVIAMCLFSLSMSISPGPVNLTILSSGVNYGFKRSLPFVSGATIGFTILLAAVGLGLSRLVTEAPLFFELLPYAGAAYMGYIGWKILSARPDMGVREEGQPRLRQGFLMQWLNPKAWIACVSGVSAFGLDGSYAKLLVFICIYFVICYLSLAVWALAGSRLQFLAKVKNGMKALNLSMGGSLVIVAVYLLFSN